MSAHVFALVNQKGGIGKTTAAIHIGVGLENRGYKTLIIDMDAQCNLTFSLGGDYQHQPTIMDAILGKVDVLDCIQELDEVDVIPGSSNLSTLENRLPQDSDKEFFLEDVIRPLKKVYDYIVIDSPPALSLITVGIMVAADSLIIPAGMDMYSLQGIGQLYRTYSAVKQYCNEGLSIEGILVTKNSITFRKLLKETADNMGVKIFRSIISQCVSIQHAVLSQQSMYRYSPDSRSVEEFYGVVDELLENRQKMSYRKSSKFVNNDSFDINRMRKNVDHEERFNETLRDIGITNGDDYDIYKNRQ